MRVSGPARPSGVTIDEVKARYAIPFDDFGIAVFHPVTSEADTIGAQAASLFERLEAKLARPRLAAEVVATPAEDWDAAQIGDALDKVNGDVEFSSTDSAMRQVKPVVVEIELGWPQ